MNTVWMRSVTGEFREVEAPSEELIRYMAAGWVHDKQGPTVKEDSNEPGKK